MKYDLLDLDKIKLASKVISKSVNQTILQYNKRLSKLNNCNVWLKREDLQEVRSLKFEVLTIK